MAAAACIRIQMAHLHYSKHAIYFFPLSRMDSLASGALLAMLSRKEITRRLAARFPTALKRVQIVTLVLGSVLLFTVRMSYLTWWSYSVTSLLFCCMVGSTVVQGTQSSLTNRLLSSRPMLYIGRRSYGIYLYHFPVVLLFERIRVHHSISNFAIVTALRIGVSIGLAAISYKFVESPILAIKSRFERSCSASSKAVEVGVAET